MTLVIATIHHISYIIKFFGPPLKPSIFSFAILTVAFQWTIRICNYNTSLGCASLTILLSARLYLDTKC